MFILKIICINAYLTLKKLIRGKRKRSGDNWMIRNQVDTKIGRRALTVTARRKNIYTRERKEKEKVSTENERPSQDATITE